MRTSWHLWDIGWIRSWRKTAFEAANWLATLLLLRSLVAALTGKNFFRK